MYSSIIKQGTNMHTRCGTHLRDYSMIDKSSVYYTSAVQCYYDA